MSRGKLESAANILAELIARRGYARVESLSASQTAWQEAVGPALAALSRPGRTRGGALQVIVANSTLVQEFQFRKPELLARMKELLPAAKIQDLKFKIGPLK